MEQRARIRQSDSPEHETDRQAEDRSSDVHFKQHGDRREDINAALKRSKERGVKVRILLDQQEYHGASTRTPNANHDEDLAKSGVDVRYKMYSERWDYRTAKQMHCKYVIVDDGEVLTGSFNLSASSELKTLENLISIRDKRAVAAYAKRFELKWNYGEGEFDALLKRIRTAKRKPRTFSPISMTGTGTAETTAYALEGSPAIQERLRAADAAQYGEASKPVASWPSWTLARHRETAA